MQSYWEACCLILCRTSFPSCLLEEIIQAGETNVGLRKTKPGDKPGFVGAEGVGFEPTVARVDHNGFRDRPNRPLWHPSSN